MSEAENETIGAPKRTPPPHFVECKGCGNLVQVPHREGPPDECVKCAGSERRER